MLWEFGVAEKEFGERGLALCRFGGIVEHGREIFAQCFGFCRVDDQSGTRRSQGAFQVYNFPPQLAT